MKFDSGHSLAQFVKGTYRNVEALMPLKPARKKNNRFVVTGSPGARPEDAGVDVIDENGTLIFSCPRTVFFQPQVVGKNHVVREPGAEFLNQLQCPNPEGPLRNVEHCTEQLRHNIVNVKNDSCAGQFRIPGGKDKKVRDVVNVNDVITLPVMPPR